MPSRHHREKPVLVSSRLIPYLSRVHEPPSSFLFSPSSDPRATSLSVLPSRETRTRSAVSFFADPPSVSPCEEDRNARGQVYRRNGTVSMDGKEYSRDGLKSGLLCLKGEGNCCTLKKGLLLRRGYYSTDSTTRGYLTKKSVISEYR